MDNKKRCAWVPLDNPLYLQYHDEEWGVPVHDERLLFEFLVLEGAQAGLSWLTILRRRENYRAAFDNFNPQKIALYDEKKIAELMQDSSIIRNRLKIQGAVINARAFLEVQAKYGSFDSYIWNFVDGKPLVNQRKNIKEIPPTTPLSDTISKELKKKGFKFVGSTIIYSHMQATGMVNDHTTDCFRYEEIIKG
ncbi:MAG: DNA-3-methyladenine glycosylase [Acidobacteriota bacterium]|nr:DNA-3-methyladenine glycosylase [Acidobacteriota bacterium]